MVLRKNSTFPKKVISIHYGVIYRGVSSMNVSARWTLRIYFSIEKKAKKSGKCFIFIIFELILNNGVKSRKMPNTFYIQLI